MIGCKPEADTAWWLAVSSNYGEGRHAERHHHGRIVLQWSKSICWWCERATGRLGPERDGRNLPICLKHSVHIEQITLAVFSRVFLVLLAEINGEVR